ncbi:MAG: uracil-DNA glycosylase [Corynebacterium sp.]|nr:uracil-DNA glycosylase [Corynebacterium sp.]
MHEGWVESVKPTLPIMAERIANVEASLQTGQSICPPLVATFRALRQSPEETKVLILGQDPYPTPGHAMGLAFSVSPNVHPLPRSLANIYTEYHDDLGLPLPTSGDLSPWTSQGVLLLNRTLTTQSHAAGGHIRLGWEVVTDAIIRTQMRIQPNIVYILWGNSAQSVLKNPALDSLDKDKHVISSPHPSPLSARRGFFGSKPFSRANQLLSALGREPVNWELPTTEGLF